MTEKLFLTAGDGVGTGKVFHYIKGKFDTHQRVYRELLGQQMGPDIHQVAQALARKFAWRIQPDTKIIFKNAALKEIGFK